MHTSTPHTTDSEGSCAKLNKNISGAKCQQEFINEETVGERFEFSVINRKLAILTVLYC